MKKINNPVAKYNNEKKRAYDREYYHKKQEKIKLRSTERYYAYREELAAQQRQRREDNYERHLLSTAKSRCKKYSIPFDLSVEDIVIPEVCPLLKVKLTTKQGNGKAFPETASLDRIDPTKGYVKGNVWVISQRANRMKNDASFRELLVFATSIMEHFSETA